MNFQSDNNLQNKGLPRYWSFLCIFNLLITSFLGLLMRYKIVFALPFIDQTHLLYAHYHFVFAGWVTLTLASCFIVYLLPAEAGSRLLYRVLFFLLEGTALGMLITFLFQGYGAFSVSFTFLSELVFYIFIICIWRDLKTAHLERDVRWFAKIAMIWYILSSFGPYMLTYMHLSSKGNPIEMRAALYFYLHFQYNGWFTFALFALLLNWLHKIHFSPPLIKMKVIFWLLTVGVLPGYFLSIIGFYSYRWIEVLSTFSVISHFIAGTMLFLIVLKGYKYIGQRIPKETNVLWKIATAAYFLKTAMQGAILVPSLATFAFAFRPLIIGYLHLIFLCFISFFLIGFLFYHHQLDYHGSLRAKVGMAVFIISVLISEVILFGQSFFTYISVYFGFFPLLLFWITLGIFVGLLLFLTGQKVNTRRII